ncbi:MAG: polysaccharide biosynthesis/export family protein [Gammaproteobacteria bacterium]|nr:polysaccharide biosynthesis/export family protein [Gammaproteobacteria bacterium]
MNTALPIMVRLVVFLGLSWMVAGAAADGDDNKGYRIQPGDVLHIDVWHEEELQRETLVRPDGGISFPLVGDINAEGRTAVALTAEITEKLVRFIPDPVVTVTVAQAAGNRLYVLGEVARPGEFAMSRPVNVLQALAMAGGLTPYADRDSIQVLRGSGDQQKAMPFDYADVAGGRSLEQNIQLQPGDVVMVP